MKRTVRRGVFETNSSSVHSIVISLEDCPETDSREYILCSGEFHWGYEQLHTVQERLEYLWTAVLCCTSHYDANWDRVSTDETDKWRERIRTVLPNLVETGEDTGSIDHGDELRPWLDEMADNEWMISSYLLGKASSVTVSNDNEEELGFEYPNGPYMEFEKGN